MGKRILVILGHPDPRPERLCRGLAEAYHRSAIDAGHEVRVVDVTRLEFMTLRSQVEWEGPVPDGLREAQEAIRWAEHLVIVFPIWLGTMPALLKAFFEQVLRPGFAMEVGGPGRWNKLLTGRFSLYGGNFLAEKRSRCVQFVLTCVPHLEANSD